jgi:hypothetical protein
MKLQPVVRDGKGALPPPPTGEELLNLFVKWVSGPECQRPPAGTTTPAMTEAVAVQFLWWCFKQGGSEWVGAATPYLLDMVRCVEAAERGDDDS